MADLKNDASSLFASAKNKKEQLKQHMKIEDTAADVAGTFDVGMDKHNQFEQDFLNENPVGEITATADTDIKESKGVNVEAFGDVVTNTEPKTIAPEPKKVTLPKDYFVDVITVKNKNELDSLESEIANWKHELDEAKHGKKKKKGNEPKTEYEELKLSVDKAKEFKEQSEQIDELEKTIEDLEAKRKELLEKIRLEAEELKKSKEKDVEVLRKDYKDNPKAVYFGDNQRAKDKKTKKVLTQLFIGLGALAAIILVIVIIVNAPPKVPDSLKISVAGQQLETIIDGDNQYYYSRGVVELYATINGKSDSKTIEIINRTPTVVDISKGSVANNERFTITPKMDTNGENPLGGLAEIFVKQVVGGQERHDSIKILIDTPVLEFNFAFLNNENHLQAATGDNLTQGNVLNVIGQDYQQTGASKYEFYMGQYADISTIARFTANQLGGGFFAKTTGYEIIAQELDTTYNPLGKSELRINKDDLVEGDIGYGQDVLIPSEDGKYLIASYPGSARVKCKTLKYLGGTEEWVTTEEYIDIIVKIPPIKNVDTKRNDVYLGYNNQFKISDIITLIEGEYAITQFGDKVLDSNPSKWTAQDTQNYNNRKNLNSLLYTLHGNTWWNFDKTNNNVGNNFDISYSIDEVIAEDVDGNETIHTETFVMFNRFTKTTSSPNVTTTDWNLSDNAPNVNIFLGDSNPVDGLPKQLATLLELNLMYNLDIKVQITTLDQIMYGSYLEDPGYFDLRTSLDKINGQPFMKLINNDPNLVRTDGGTDPYGFSLADVYFTIESAQGGALINNETFSPPPSNPSKPETYILRAHIRNGLGFALKYGIITIQNGAAIDIDLNNGNAITSASEDVLMIVV